jgi:exopolysaccharide biosynthesis polyprenyl glycosylphosphotransferase
LLQETNCIAGSMEGLSDIADKDAFSTEALRPRKRRLDVARRVRGGHEDDGGGARRTRPALLSPPPLLYRVDVDQAGSRPRPSRSHLRRLLLAGDVVALAAGPAVGFAAGAGAAVPVVVVLAALALTVGGGLVLAAIYGLYERDEQRADHTTADDFPAAVHVTLIVTWLVAIVIWAAGGGVHVAALLGQLSSTLLLILTLRAAARALHRRRGGYCQRTLVVGAGSVGQFIADKLMRRPVHGMRLIGFVDDDPPQVDGAVADVPLLGSVAQLPQLVDRLGVQRVIVAFSRHSHERTLALLRALKGVDVQVDVVPRLFDVFGPNAEIHAIDGLPLIGHPKMRPSRAEMTAKRALDLALSIGGLIALAPVFALLTLLIRLDSRGPAIYRASRVGRGGRSFTQLKFRTMHVAFCDGSEYGGERAEEAFERLLAEHAGLREQYERTHKLDPDPRVTRVGRLLRSTSLDELPQLLNVIRGELSLVGPRPVTTSELDRYGENVRELLSVRPGLTGYWQISGRSALGYDERVRLDLAYVSSWSLKLDLKILIKTTTLLTARAGAV